MKKRSLAIKFIFIVLLILMIGQGGLWMWFVHGQRAYYAESLRNKIRITADLLSSMSTSAMQNYNYAVLDQYMELLSKDEEIVSVRIKDKDGNVIREKILKGEPEGKSLNPFYIPKSNSFSAPVKAEGGSIGIVEITYSGLKVNAEILKLITVSPAGQLLVFAFVIFAIYYFFQRKIGRPIEMLNMELKRATEGDLTVRIPEFGGDEIGSMAEGIKILIERLVSTLDKLRSTVDNVSMAINQLNLTFKNVTEGTRKQTQSIQAVMESIRQANESQKLIASDTDKLIDFSNENVTSLLEMKATSDEIASSTGKLFKVTEDAYSFVGDISKTSKSVAANTEATSSAVDDASASLEEIIASVKEVDVKAKESSTLASKVTEVTSEVGMMSVLDAVEGMEKISTEVKHSAEIISRLGTRSADIEKILSVIKDVTEKTNLLSLNAAILAAQAGEYGKSFSVVADEIRGLSDRTASSTRDISGIIKTIQEEIAEAVTSIDSGMKRVEEGNVMVYRVGEALRETLVASEHSVNMSSAIERATEEQSRALTQVSEAVENIRKMMSQIARSASEQQRGTGRLLDSVSDVKDASNIVNQGTAEEASSIKMISRNLELADERIKQIGQSTSSQQKTNENIMSSMDQIKGIGTNIIQYVEDVSMSLVTLREEIMLLRNEMDSFKTESGREM